MTIVPGASITPNTQAHLVWVVVVVQETSPRVVNPSLYSGSFNNGLGRGKHDLVVGYLVQGARLWHAALARQRQRLSKWYRSQGTALTTC